MPSEEGAGVGREGRKGGMERRSFGQSSRLSGQPGKSKKGICHPGMPARKGAVGKDKQSRAGSCWDSL